MQEEEKGTIVHHLSTPRGVKKSLKSLPRGVRKAANNIKHKTTADSVPEWLTFYGDEEGSNTEKRVPYTFFVTREWEFLLCVKRE